MDRASLPAIVLLKESRAALRDANSSRVLELKKFVFERLNTGGKQLDAQEIRNAMYSGKFNDLIIHLARNRMFTTIWKIPPYSEEYSESDYESPERKKNTLYKTMGDCQIVLRFFALRDDNAIKGSMRSILDRCMEQNLPIDDVGVNALELEYIARLATAVAVFDGKPFRLADKPKEQPSESMYDAVMIAIDRLWYRKEDLLKAKNNIQRAYWSVLDTSEKIEQFSGRANTASDVRARIDSMTALFRTALRDARL